MSRATLHLRVLIPALAALAVLLFAATAQADYEQVGNFAQSGNGEQLNAQSKEGIAVNSTGAGGVEAGSVYVSADNRVSRYNAKGEIKEVWGWNTIASGPDLPNQVNTLKVSATSGTYEIEARTAFGAAQFTEGFKVVDVWTEGGAFHVGDAITGGTANVPAFKGTGDISAGSKTITSVSNGNIEPGCTISGQGIPSGTTITAYEPATQTLTLSQAATQTAVGTSLETTTTVAGVGAGTLELSNPANGSTGTTGPAIFAAAETTAPIPYEASATQVQEALLALPAFGPGDVTVTGTPGNYEISFEGSYGGTPVRLKSTESTLTGGVPSTGATFSTSIDPAEPRFERCRPDDGDTCVSQWFVRPGPGEKVGAFASLRGIAVDQSTGYVYVLNGGRSGRTHNLIEVFSADGSESITRFGDLPGEGDTIETSPEKMMRTENIAVGEGGKVYVSSASEVPKYPESRVMCFRPEAPGDYERYVYCGRSQDVKVSGGELAGVELAVDDAGHLYWNNGAAIQELSLAEPANPVLLCTYNTGGAARGMTANPLTGEVFYFNSANSDRRVHRLKPCDAEGKFVEAQAPVGALPPPGANLGALAINPTLSWGPNRPAGVLYGAAIGFHEIEDVKSAGLGYIFAPAEVHSPAIESESVSNTRTTSAILHAAINPHGFATHYVFQYLSEAHYEANEPTERFAGAAEAPAGGGAIGGGSVGQATTSISGLEPDTTYRFRVVATSECDPGSGEPCVVEGEALSFATYPLFSPGLPDHRAYEMVSPAQKHGGEVIPAEPEVGSCGSECKPSVFGKIFPIQSSPDGEALAYEGQPFNPVEGAVNYDSYVARRTASGWQSTALIPALPPEGVKELAFDPSLDHGLLAIGGSQLETQDAAEPSSTTPLVSEPNHRSANELQLAYGGHSADFSRIFFAANDTLTKETPFAPEPPDPGTSKNDLYEWHNGQLALVNVLPGNGAVAEGATFASLSPDAHAISEDGSMVFFAYEGGIYARIDGEETVRIATSQRTTPDPLGARAQTFMGASADGTQVLFSSPEELTDDSNTGLAREVVVQATAGTYKLTFQGDTTGATGTGATTAGSEKVTGLTTSTGTFVVGEAISGAGIPPKTTIIAVGSGTLTLSSAATATGTGVALAADLPWNAVPSTLQDALEALPSIGKGNVAGSAGKEGPIATFVNSLALNQESMTVDGSGLTGTVSLRSFRPGKDLYLWNEGTLADLTPGQGSWSMQGIVGTARDLSHIYFVDTAVLGDGEANEAGEVAEAGKYNLYSWSGGEAVFVAQLSISDNAGQSSFNFGNNDWDSNPAHRSAEASPSGRFLAFASDASLTGYDNVGPCQEVEGGEKLDAPCHEAFLYDSNSGKLTCASCNPTGEAPLGPSALRRINGSPEQFPQPRYLTNEGRLYFDTQDSLSARDTNEGVEDVYEYSPQGAGKEGTCEREAGCVRLISAGTEAVDSNLIAVDETGKNVFFDTRDKLALKDKDELLDIYDAREGGGIAAESEIARAECQGENCQAPASPPNDPTPASSSFEGSGNVKEEPVAKKHVKKKHAKKHKKKAKKHAKQARTAKRNHGGAK